MKIDGFVDENVAERLSFHLQRLQKPAGTGGGIEFRVIVRIESNHFLANPFDHLPRGLSGSTRTICLMPDCSTLKMAFSSAERSIRMDLPSGCVALCRFFIEEFLKAAAKNGIQASNIISAEIACANSGWVMLDGIMESFTGNSEEEIAVREFCLDAMQIRKKQMLI